MMYKFRNREEAGERLAKRLSHYKNVSNALILCIPRGGVIFGSLLSERLNIPLDIVLVKKIGHPSNSEFAIGAVAQDGEITIHSEFRSSVHPDYLLDEITRLRSSIQERLKFLRGARPTPDVKGKTVILVDDGIATGFTVQAAIEWLRKQGVQKVILAIPVAPEETMQKMASLADECVVLQVAEDFHAIGEFYEDFHQISDAEIKKILLKKLL